MPHQGIEDITGSGAPPESDVAPAPADAWHRLLAEHTSDVVMEVDAGGDIVWVSSSVELALGWRPDELAGQPMLALVHPDDRAERRRVRPRLEAGERVGDVRCRFVQSDGDWHWMAVHAQPAGIEAGTFTGIVLGLRDIHATVLAERAAATLAAGNAILVRARNEPELLGEMCQAAVDAGGYLLAWYGRPGEGLDYPVEIVSASAEHRDYLETIEVSWGKGALGRGPAGRVLRSGVTARVHDIETDRQIAPWSDTMLERGFRSMIGVPVTIGGLVDGVIVVYAAEPFAFDAHAAAVLEHLASQLAFGLQRIRDGERLARAQATQALLRTAIDQASEGVVVSDTTPSILYVNPAAAHVLGYSIEEMVGQDPTMFQSPNQAAGFYAAVLDALSAGGSWHGTMISRCKDGDDFEGECTIAPVTGPNGEVVATVAVTRDLAPQRALEAAIGREQQDREAVIGIVDRVRPAETVQGTAAAFCREVETADGFDGAMVIMLQPDGRAVPYATAGHPPEGMGAGLPIEVARMDEVLARTLRGPWTMDLGDPSIRELVGAPVHDALIGAGITATAYAVIRWGGEPSGVLAVASHAPDGAAILEKRLAMLGELGSFAALLFGAQAEQFSEQESLRSEVRAVIDTHAYEPVFQPVIDTATGAPCGYEALTRFADGLRPDLRFASARSVGLGSELEGCCARAALEAAAPLPDDLWVAFNFSPDAVIDGTAASVLGEATRPVVIEVTEHAPIGSYADLRSALLAIPNARLAVDDAGAGYASLRHILELRPDIVKLDAGLVRDLDVDGARQALAAGLCEFAVQTGTQLIAEGVETTAEADVVRRLGIRYAQGFLFGRPRALSATRPGPRAGSGGGRGR